MFCRRSFLQTVGALSLALAFPKPAKSGPRGSGRFVPLGIPGNPGSPFLGCRFFPFDGDGVMVDGVLRKIPAPGIDWMVNDATIDGVPHQTLMPFTVYTAYLGWGPNGPRPEWSQTGWRTDDGSQLGDRGDGVGVKATDRSMSVIGLVRTDEQGKLRGDDRNQCTASFFNRVRIPIKCRVVDAISGPTGANYWVEPNSENRISFVCWQDDIPGVVLNGSVTNNSLHSHTEVAIGIDSNNAPGSSISVFDCLSAGSTGLVNCRATHDGGMAEGFHYFTVLMSVWSGTAALRAGSSPMWDKTFLQSEQVPS